MSIIQVGDVGTVIELDVVEDGVAVDISGASTIQYVFSVPDGTTKTVTAALKTDGLDGKTVYATQTGDLSKPGQWKVQVSLVMPAWSGHTRPVGFYVAPNLG